MNQSLTERGQEVLNDISQRYNLSSDSALSMLISVNNGGGTMAQFSCPELGSGQWMSGGMTMVGDMFNHGLKNTVNNLCSELSNALATHQLFKPRPQHSGSGGGNNWWPGDLGVPASSGRQNNTRYAYFPSSRRLAVERNGKVQIFDTLDYNISGVSQQQGGGDSLTFSSQYGTVSTLSLPLVSGQSNDPAPQTNFIADSQPTPVQKGQPSSAPQDENASELLALLEKLGQLKEAGVLTKQEFNDKKSDILSRI